MKKTELLIPVGNKECLFAAIHNGADAVYLGGKRFGARAYSTNFDEEEMKEAISLCHLYGVKIYVTVNTIIYPEEIKEALEYLRFLYIHRVDAVIMQDIGLIQLTRKYIPNLEIHISTQAHNHNKEGLSFFEELGAKRVVFDRESSLKEINSINTSLEKEIFVYGALCVCYSGNCLFSALNGKRSANRGMCVGSCRLPYTLEKEGKNVKSGYLLSTKDLNTIPYLKEILDSQITSLKVEGRMKSKEYVAIVTKVYRRLIDAYYINQEMQITEEEKRQLLQTYNRTFTEGYLFEASSIMNPKTSNHQGISIGEIIGVTNRKIKIRLTEDIHQGDAIRFSSVNKGMYVNTLYNEKDLLTNCIKKGNIAFVDNKERIMYDDLIHTEVLRTIDVKLNEELSSYEEKKIPVTFRFVAKKGEACTLEVSDKEHVVSICGPVVLEAKTQPMSEEKIREQLSKVGGTAFSLSSIDLELDSSIFINIRDLNALRREVLSSLEKERIGELRKCASIKEISFPSIAKQGIEFSILVRTEVQLVQALKNSFTCIYVTDKNLYTKYKKYPNVYLRLERVCSRFEELEGERLLCQEIGSVMRYKDKNKIRTDYACNCMNDATLSTLHSLGALSSCLSVEMEKEQYASIKNKRDAEAIIYGRLECMVIKNDIYSLKDSTAYLVDDKKHKYPVYYKDGLTHIMHYQPIDMIDSVSTFRSIGLLRIELFSENAEETQNIINRVKSKY